MSGVIGRVEGDEEEEFMKWMSGVDETSALRGWWW